MQTPRASLRPDKVANVANSENMKYAESIEIDRSEKKASASKKQPRIMMEAVSAAKLRTEP